MIADDDLALFEASLRHATQSSTGGALDAALRDLGWRDALDADQRAAVSLLFELQGRSNSTSSALDQVILHALGAGETKANATVLPPLGHVLPPGRSADDGIELQGVASGGADVVLVAIEGGGFVTVASGDLQLRPVTGMDPALGLVEVSGSGLAAEALPLDAERAWADAVAVGQLALAHELIGASRAMVALARDHAVERIQFGRPIAQFQAVRHRLADAYVAVESAEAAALGAWDDGTPLAAAVAKAVAGRNARLVARHCQQVLAGIGFTAEHALHRYVRRVLVLDRLLGDARSLTVAVGEELLRTRRIPPLLPL